MIPKEFLTKFYQMRTTNSKLFMFKFQYQMGKTKKWEKISALQNGEIRGLQIGAGFRDYKSE